jgi:uncharacterized protein YlxW (UPF0749 family)
MSDLRDRSRPDRPLPEHVTAPLLSLITSRSMDEDYAHVARLRAEAEQQPDAAGGTTGTGRPRWLTPVVVAVFGILVAVAAVQTSRDADTRELGRAALVRQIETGRDTLGELQGRITTLTNANRASEDRNAVLEEQLRESRARLLDLEVATGYTRVRGPGVRIRVDDNPTGDITQEVRDEDLATLVDGLWEAGAEAISVNGQRLNAIGGIRNTGRAIHVNGRPLTAPYTVLAIGDTDSLQADLLASSQGNAWYTLVNSLGFEFEISNAEDLRLPAATLRPLRHLETGTAEHNAARPKEGANP